MSYHKIWLPMSSYNKSLQMVISDYSSVKNRSASEILEER